VYSLHTLKQCTGPSCTWNSTTCRTTKRILNVLRLLVHQQESLDSTDVEQIIEQCSNAIIRSEYYPRVNHIRLQAASVMGDIRANPLPAPSEIAIGSMTIAACVDRCEEMRRKLDSLLGKSRVSYECNTKGLLVQPMPDEAAIQPAIKGVYQ
jgi:hypothetical protein